MEHIIKGEFVVPGTSTANSILDLRKFEITPVTVKAGRLM